MDKTMDKTITQVVLDASEANLRSAMIKTIKQGEPCVDGSTGCCGYTSGTGDGFRCVVGHMVSADDATVLSRADETLGYDCGVGVGISEILSQDLAYIKGQTDGLCNPDINEILSDMQSAHDEWLNGGSEIITKSFNEIIEQFPSAFPSGSITQAEIDAHA